MTSYALLNNVEHKDLKIITDRSEKFGSNQMYSMLFPMEFREAQAYYPIFFQKNTEGGFFAIALFGFDKGENLYLTEDGWDAEYIPLMIEKDPFLIGFQRSSDGQTEEDNAVIHVDMDSPRISKTEGNPVFLAHGGNSDYLSRISAILKTVYDAQENTDKFLTRITELDLLESFNFDVRLSDGSINRLAGLYTINEEKVIALSGEVLDELNASGMLALLYFAIASQSNIRKIAARKNAIS